MRQTGPDGVCVMQTVSRHARMQAQLILGGGRFHGDGYSEVVQSD